MNSCALVSNSKTALDEDTRFLLGEKFTELFTELIDKQGYCFFYFGGIGQIDELARIKLFPFREKYKHIQQFWTWRGSNPKKMLTLDERLKNHYAFIIEQSDLIVFLSNPNNENLMLYCYELAKNLRKKIIILQ